MVANRTVWSVETVSGGVTAGRGGCDRYPLAPGAIVAQLSHVLRFGAVHVNKPMPRFRMHVDFSDRAGPDRAGENPHDEMTVGGKGVVAPLLLRREVPVRIQPVRIARGQQQLPGPIGLGQCRFFGSGLAGGGRRPQGILLSRAGHGRRDGFVALQENLRNPETGFGLRRFVPGLFCAQAGRGLGLLRRGDA